ncbi:MAG: hypothetical protein AAB874_07720 [Patescibacteria group bacterium]
MDKKITITQNIGSPEIREQIWKNYEQSFAVKELECAQNQKCYDWTTFLATLSDPDYFKYYLEIDGKVIAYMLSTNNLEKAKITYFNPERYFLLFPEYAPNRINYCTSLAVLAEYKESKAFYEIMSEFLNHIFNTLNGMLAFDFAHETMSKLPKILQLIWKKGKRTGNLEYIKVGAQEFSGMVLKKSTE